ASASGTDRARPRALRVAANRRDDEGGLPERDESSVTRTPDVPASVRAMTVEARIRCVIMRGGTSKAVFFSPCDLPSDPAERDALIVAVFGSPDVRQIDGLGGADPLTSKLAIVGPSADPEVDVDYTFGQVGIVSPTINYRVNCGNTAAAVGLYALQEGLADACDGTSSVAIRCTNSGKLVIAEVPAANGEPIAQGRFRIAGVPRPGAEIRLTFLDPAGGVTGRLLP